MKIMVISFLIFVIVAFIFDNLSEKENLCDHCDNRFCVSNQHPTICDECKDGSNYTNWLDGGR